MRESSAGIGVVGAGSIGIRSALDHFALKDVQDKANIVAICDNVSERAKAAADKYGVPAWYGSYEELLKNPNVDIVTLCSPIGLHYDQAIMALNAGKHIHCNKTITTTVAEIDEIMNLAAAKGLKVVSSPGMMLMPHNQRMRRAVLEGRLGRVTLAITGGTGGQMYHINEPLRQGNDVLTSANPSWYFKKPGGGPLYDIVVYFLHILTGILGPVQRVSAFSGQTVPQFEYRGEIIRNEMDDTTFISLDFGDMLYGHCNVTTEGELGGKVGPFTPYIIGGKGMLNGAQLGDKCLIYEGDHQPHVTPAHKKLSESHVYEDIMQLVDWVHSDIASIANLDHARHVIDIIESAYNSESTGKIITLKQPAYKPLPLEELAEI